MLKFLVVNLNIFIAIGFVTTANVKQPPPVKLDWIPLHPANKSDPHPLNTTGPNDSQQERAFGDGLSSALQFFAKINGAISQFQGIASLVKAGVDLRKLFGLDPKDNAILVDNRCPKCWLYVKCGTNVKNTEDFEVSPEDGLILRFRTNPPFDIFDNYVCESHDLGYAGNGNPGLVTGDRRATIDVYGRSATKKNITLIEVRNDQIVSVDMGGFIETKPRPISW